MLSAGLISHNSIYLLIITTDFVVIITLFLAGVESGDQCLLNSEVLSRSRSFFLLLGKMWAPGITSHPYIYTRCLDRNLYV